MQKILIIGATSAIAEAAARCYAQRGDALYLLARNAERLDALLADLKIRGAASTAGAPFDANDFDQHAMAVERAVSTLGGLDIVLIAHGTLPDQKACEADATLALKEISTNALSVISLLTDIANRFAAQRRGAIAVIGSVAGDRGRQSNYIYGSAKGMLAVFLQGLRNRLSKSGVQVLTIKPGFVDTPMTAAFPKGPLWATPEQVGSAIVQAIDSQRNVLYTPFFWWGIMAIIRAVPESIFKKLSL
ncbi:SDR family oxidoreductase [Duganella sp. sic0402]|uniref:SDR family oxidoreductase n=1 Tax=Duganella sp. sic0402 TaxID=2854786 RepID=UPI001C4862DE|nr:SDR family oxidoreductase [Duganella sp. sic0402]MBV7537483.1 SDR family oxidoreductase [Duganella sp. sic0402]